FMDEDGYVTVVDRLKDMIVTGAENVYSAEVENAIGAHPAVASCAVIGVPDARWGERVHAVVVLHPGAVLTEDDVRTHTRALIAGYKCPRSVEFVTELPLTAAGKVAKTVLRDNADDAGTGIAGPGGSATGTTEATEAIVAAAPAPAEDTHTSAQPTEEGAS
ncbi:MAG: hypothetical protein HOU01_03660, partial [Streptomycetaceae bacterium]|nr:hypothetical protein [Streptomycetaceae bacterium]